MPSTERTPLLWDFNSGQIQESDQARGRHRELPQARTRDLGEDVHSQFCALVGCRPSNAPPDYKHKTNELSLYGRATQLLRSQRRTYNISASISNTLLLVQVVLGAALTGLGASNSPGWVITIFGATNTVIAGVVAYLKSRGQPMRARVYRDDLERVVDEIENSEVMWLGISQGVHGYDDIDTDNEVTVRSEIARLTRLYDKAVRNNTMNNPDMYMAGQTESNARAGLRMHGGGSQMTNIALPATIPASDSTTMPSASAPAPAQPAAAADDPDQSPASAPSKPKEDSKKDAEEDVSKDKKTTATEATDDSKSKTPTSSSDDKGKSANTNKDEASAATQSTPSAPAEDPDAAPASKAKFSKPKKDEEGGSTK